MTYQVNISISSMLKQVDFICIFGGPECGAYVYLWRHQSSLIWCCRLSPIMFPWNLVFRRETLNYEEGISSMARQGEAFSLGHLRSERPSTSTLSFASLPFNFLGTHLSPLHTFSSEQIMLSLILPWISSSPPHVLLQFETKTDACVETRGQKEAMGPSFESFEKKS